MKTIAVLFALVSVAVAVEVIPVLARSDVRDSSGQFSHSYQSGDGTYLAEQGRLVPTADGKDYVLIKEGSYKFLTPEGRTIELKYVADAQGFRPVGAHLPVSVVA